MDEPLKPCPFCGSAPRTRWDGTAWRLECIDLDCIIRPSVVLWDKEAVTDAWNRRPDGITEN